MKAKEAREKAKDILQDTIAVAYYKVVDNKEFEKMSEEDKNAIIDYINQYGKAACKAFGRKYVTY